MSILKYEGRRDKWRIQNFGKQQKSYVSSGHIPYQLHNPDTCLLCTACKGNGTKPKPYVRTACYCNMTGPLIAYWANSALSEVRFVRWSERGHKTRKIFFKLQSKSLNMKYTSFVSCPIFVPPSAGWITFEDGGRTILENVRTYHRARYKKHENSPISIFGPQCEGNTFVLR